LASNAAENEGVQALLRALEHEVEQIHEVLLNADSEEVSDYQRDRMIDQKKLYTRVIKYFTSAKSDLEQLEKTLDINI